MSLSLHDILRDFAAALFQSFLDEADKPDLQEGKRIEVLPDHVQNRLDMHLAVIDSFRWEYDQFGTQYRALDTKAQATATVAGVLLTAILAVGKLGQTPIPVAQQMLFGLAMILLLCTFALSVMAIRIKSTVRPPGGDFLQGLLERLEKVVDSESELSSRRIAFWGEQAAKWSAANQSILETNQKKARYLGIAQWLLLGAIVDVAFIASILLAVE